MKKIIAMLLTIMVIFSLTACGCNKKVTNDIKRNEPWQDVDKQLREDLDDMILHTEYDDGQKQVRNYPILLKKIHKESLLFS